MNRKLSSWASIAEIVSGLAVVVTLLFAIIFLSGLWVGRKADSLQVLQCALVVVAAAAYVLLTIPVRCRGVVGCEL